MGFDDKHIVFGGAGAPGAGTPWGTMGEIATRALAPFGYEVKHDGRAWGPDNPRLISDGAMDFGAGHSMRVRWAYEGKYTYARDGPRPQIRIVAAIEHPSWMAAAVRWETGITDLSQIRERQLPVRVHGGVEAAWDLVWAHYGLSREMIESWGGKFLRTPAPLPGYPSTAERSLRAGDFDVIMDTLYAANTPEVRHWLEASVLFNLRFLPLPEEVVEKICTEVPGRPGSIPHRLVRGVEIDTPSVRRGPQVYFGRADMPDDFVYVWAQALDQARDLFRQTLIPFSYDPATVAQDVGVPYHPGALRYYRDKGYPAS